MNTDVVARYFEMWNTGDSAVALEIMAPGWIDYAHPDVHGPEGVRAQVDKVRAAEPDLRFEITAIMGEGDLVTVVGQFGTIRLVWVVRVENGLMAEMRTYREV